VCGSRERRLNHRRETTFPSIHILPVFTLGFFPFCWSKEKEYLSQNRKPTRPRARICKLGDQQIPLIGLSFQTPNKKEGFFFMLEKWESVACLLFTLTRPFLKGQKTQRHNTFFSTQQKCFFFFLTKKKILKKSSLFNNPKHNTFPL